MRIREVLIHPYGLIRCGSDNGKLDGGCAEDIVDQVARARHSAYTIADDTRSGGVAGEGEGSAGLSGRSVIEAVFVELGAARSRKGQRYCSAGEGCRYFSKGKDAEGTWRYESVIVHEAAIRLVIGEGRAVGVGGCYSADDKWYATVQRGGWGAEGALEVAE